ncbi:MAG: Zn-ribbon domain-containing OB-fold protein [Anaerolineales bacterium]|nr:Zn-ribbon domain-containing OB-fold protein [Chloroflexota bacterium]MBL7161677.1 Zn-ribbon domain-containing OB-fold protein [Anaerolineales bacterium]
MTLLKRDPKAPQAWLGNLPVTSRYTFGLGGERFFRSIKDEGEILGTHCPKCDRTYVPSTIFCERCLGKLEEWVDVGTTGNVHTFTLLYENYDGSHREEPEIIAFVSIGDGGLVHRLGDVEPEEVEIGMEVEVVFKPKAEREGSILDIVHFRPIA